jgi:hypothetical protein
MQIESKDLYKEVAEKNSVNLELIKSIGDTVFLEMNRLIKNPPNLILDLRGLGRRFVRKKKSESVLRNLKLDIVDPANKRSKEELQSEIEMLEGLLIKYEVFLEKKRKTKELRYAFETPLQSSVQKEEIQEASKDHTG